MYSDGFGKVMILKQACLLFSLSLSQYHSLDLRKAMRKTSQRHKKKRSKSEHGYKVVPYPSFMFSDVSRKILAFASGT